MSEYPRILGRAITAQSIVLSEEQEVYPRLSYNADIRDRLVESIANKLGEDTRAIDDWARRRILRALAHVGTEYFMPRRDDLGTAWLHPFAGDILLYQLRGAPIREFVRAVVAGAPAPIVILSHSLGGVISVDVLAASGLAVKRLITVGSQAPVFYAMDVLSSLNRGEQLPKDFPDWLNFYDPRDFLSYVGERLFSGRVTDVPVDNGQPFPQAHSAYWENEEVWRKIAEVLP